MKAVFRYIILTVVLFNCHEANAQYLEQSSIYMFDQYRYIPAYAGLDYSLSANIHVRDQWQGIEKNPGFAHLNVHMPFYAWSGALGGQVSTRSAGALRQNDVRFSYNYVMNMRNGLLSSGLSLGVSQLSVSGVDITTPEGIYSSGSVIHNDPVLPTQFDFGLAPIWSLSTYYKSEYLSLGGSLGGLPGQRYSFENFSFQNNLHAILYGSYTFRVLGEYEVLQSILLKSDFSQVQTDISSIVKINGNVFGGLGVRGYSSRSIDAIIVTLGLRFNKHYTLTYSYDAGISGLRSVHEGSHELLLNYNLQKLIGTGLPPKIIYNPRHL